MNAVLYARVSTDEQADRDLSIPAQLRLMRDHARDQGWTIVKEFTEPGMSATNADRPVLQEMLAGIKTGALNTDVVLAHKLNRLARNLDDYIPIRSVLARHRVRLCYVVERVDDSPSGRLLENVMASLAQYESANLSEETKKGMRQKVLQGGWPHRPLRGYVIVRNPEGTRSSIAIHPREGALVAKAFELYSTGLYSVQAVAARLAREGLVSRSGGPVPKSQFHRMLTNSFYIGRVQWKDLDVQGLHPPLISLELFEKVQTVVHNRFKNPNPSGFRAKGLPLRRFATCSTCRGRMGGEWHERWGYYRCGRRSYRKEMCSSRMCNADKVHKDLRRICQSIQITRATAAAIQRAADEIILLRDSRMTNGAALQKRNSDWLATAEKQLTEAFMAGDVASGVYKRKAAELSAQRVESEAANTREQVPAEDLKERVARTLKLATSLWDIYCTLSDDRQHELLTTVFAVIVLGEDRVMGYTLKSPFDGLGRGSPGDAARNARAILEAA